MSPQRPFMFTTLTSLISYAIMIICLFLSLSPYSVAIPYLAGTILPTLLGVWAAGVVITYFYPKKIMEKYQQSRLSLANADLRGHWLPLIGILSIYLVSHQNEKTLDSVYIGVLIAAFIVATLLPTIYFCSRKNPRNVYPGVPRGVLALYIVPAFLGCTFLLT